MTAPPPARRPRLQRAGSGPAHGSPGYISWNLALCRRCKSRSRAKHLVSIAVATASAVPPAEQ
eukprot:2587856-Prymnesium_polylepis.1